MSLPIYIINLKSDVDRWNELLKELDKENITNYERIDAVYGKTLSDQEIKENTSLVCSYFCTYPMIGIAMSHLKCWEKLLSSPHEAAIIFEDDVAIEENFTDRLNECLQNVPDDFDIIYIGCQLSYHDNKQDNITIMLMKFLLQMLGKEEKEYKKISENLFVPSIPLGTNSYIISKKCAQKMLNKIKGNISSHIDFQMLMEGRDLKVYAINPYLTYQKKTLEASHNIISSYPIVINKMLNIKDRDNEPLSYKFSVPIGQIFGQPINALNIFLILFSLMVGFFFPNRYILFIGAFILYNLVEFLLNPGLATFNTIIFIFILMLGGFLIGRLIRGLF